LPVPTWVDIAGRPIRTLGEPGVYSGGLILSPDGKRLAYTLTGAPGNQDIWVAESSGAGNTRLTFDPKLDTSPVWSPDGARIVFASNRGGRRDLYEKSSDGSGEERLLLQSDEDKTPLDWSRDGRFLLFQSTNPKTREDLWILPLQGDTTPFAFLKTDAQEGYLAQFSPDAR
jgi:Tol biopolymer transport system component